MFKSAESWCTYTFHYPVKASGILIGVLYILKLSSLLLPGQIFTFVKELDFYKKEGSGGDFKYICFTHFLDRK